MAEVFIPNIGIEYKLQADWSPELEWVKRNLVLFKHFNFTGQKQMFVGKYYKIDPATKQYEEDDNGLPVLVDKYINKTVFNPLFKSDDGTYVPVVIPFPSDTNIVISEYRQSGVGVSPIDVVWFKVVSSPDKRLTGRVVEVSLEQLNGIHLEESV